MRRRRKLANDENTVRHSTNTFKQNVPVNLLIRLGYPLGASSMLVTAWLAYAFSWLGKRTESYARLLIVLK